jgi:S-methylmethionine-dependent homocysteine/selenocysteine methylase
MMSSVTILDGGMGKELRRIGAPFRQPEWSSLALMEAPDMVVQAHRNFIDAGARVIITNNYAVVPFHHADGFFAERGPELIGLAGRLARQAADESEHDVPVAGSMPPLFGSYEPDLFDAARGGPIYEQIALALEPHVDLWIGETLSSIAEMHSVVAAIDDLDSDMPTWMSFSLPDTWTDGVIALRSGETIKQIVESTDDRIEALLFNCSLPEQTGPALAELRRVLDATGRSMRIGGYANAFPTTRHDEYKANEVIFERRDDLTADRYADFVSGWISNGATIVGGCCDMYPEHIETLTKRFA